MDRITTPFGFSSTGVARYALDAANAEPLWTVSEALLADPSASAVKGTR